MQLEEELSSVIMQDSKLQRGFLSWIAGECRVVSRKRNRLALSETLLNKVGGSSKSSLLHSAQQHRLFGFAMIFFFRSIVPMSTFYRQFQNFALAVVEEMLHNETYPRLHWVDNYAKYY